MLGELRAAEQAVRRALDSEPARLAVGMFASAGQSLVPRALARLREDHPDVAGMPNRVCLELAAASTGFEPLIAYRHHHRDHATAPAPGPARTRPAAELRQPAPDGDGTAGGDRNARRRRG